MRLSECSEVKMALRLWTMICLPSFNRLVYHIKPRVLKPDSKFVEQNYVIYWM